MQLFRNLFLVVFSFALLFLITECRYIAPMKAAKDPSLIIPGQYIVVLDDEEGVDVDANALEHTMWLTALLGVDGNDDSKMEHKFKLHGLQGYTGKFSEDIISEIRKRPEVKYVEPDQIVYALDLIDNETRLQRMRRIFGRRNNIGKKQKVKVNNEAKRSTVKNVRSQRNAPWGISRVSHGKMPIELTKYHYPKDAGRGVDVYVIDTGINVAHADFEGRARWGVTIPFDDLDIDGNGHGTHCAGTIASRTYGIAKKAHVIAVKVLRTNGFGTNADVIKGVEWTIKAAHRAASKGRKSVANMSLGGGKSFTLERAVNNAVKSGIHFAVAAGNDNEDACDYSPAAADGPVTVGASTNQDEMAFFSNHGSCVDIFAPGLDITSTWIGSKRAINTISGTSMASPHVAGVLALYAAVKDLSPRDLKELIVKHASKDILSKLPGDTENRLLCTRRLLDEIESSKGDGRKLNTRRIRGRFAYYD